MRVLGLLLVVLLLPVARVHAQAATDVFFRRTDSNGDGKLSRDELPPPARPRFDRIDTDRDGFISLEEHRAFLARNATPTAPGKAPPAEALPVPDAADVPYGPDPRNVFDLWKTTASNAPAPLVIFFHGGGFRGGDKSAINRALVDGLRAGGISVAAANYRLSSAAPYPAQMYDAARALQFIRLHAADYGIDPARVGATGGSAGAGISEWLLFHDDRADPSSSDPVARQSSRVACAVATAAQTSYDPRFIGKLFNTTKVDPALIPFFGMDSAADVSDPVFHPLFEDASPINHVSKDDGPLMLFYTQPNTPLPPDSEGSQHIHHPKFGAALKEKMDALGLPCVLILREDVDATARGGQPVDRFVEFFRTHLKVK